MASSTDVNTSANTDVATPPHNFWDKQPLSVGSDRTGQIIAFPPRAEHLPLAPPLQWCQVDENHIDEIRAFLSRHYVGNGEFNLDYSREILLLWVKHALSIGIRDGEKKLVGFVSAKFTPVELDNTRIDSVAINFLCVDPAYRGNYLAPIMIREISRRCVLGGVQTALYTVGHDLPGSFARVNYHHRALQPRKLLDVGFYKLPPGAREQLFVKAVALPKGKSTGLVQLEPTKFDLAREALDTHLGIYRLREYTLGDHELTSIPQRYHVLWYEKAGQHCVVVFYRLDIYFKSVDKTVRQAMLQYVAAPDELLEETMLKTLHYASDRGYEVFTALDNLHNQKFLEKLAFQKGTGHLNYYMYNWHMPKLDASDVGVTLM
jgi:glycylpeptide N-tetradecanoyltransferase